ncbi:MAG: hypothetical protein K2H66_05950, partial [Oscillospiraceae bacterium]|nr:hypothetical protein [Oscillospiraceae bacterium]
GNGIIVKSDTDDVDEEDGIQLTTTKPTASVSITNTNNSLNQIEVTKIAKANGKEESDHEIKVGLFEVVTEEVPDEEGNVSTQEVYQQVKNSEILTMKTVAGKDTKIFKDLDLQTGKAYYVFELDSKILNSTESNASEAIVFDGNTVQVQGKTYVATYDKSSVVLDGNAPAALTITDTHSDDAILQFSKQDVNGDLFNGAELVITGKDLNKVSINKNGAVEADGSLTFTENTGDNITWKTDGKNNLYVKGLANGEYTLTEMATNVFASVGVTFTVKDGYIDVTSVESDAQVSASASILTVVNRSEVEISKQDIADEGNGNEVPNATMTIKRLNAEYGLNQDYITFTCGENENKTAEINGNEITFISQEVPTKITGLPDGIYELREETAPAGFLSVEGRWTFKIDKGEVAKLTDEELEELYKNEKEEETQPQIDVANIELVENSNKIILKDKKPEITIGKYDITGTTELAGAQLLITATDKDVNFENIVSVENALEDDEHEPVVKGNTIAWHSSDKDAVIKGLPDGTYILEETGNSFIVGDTTYDVLETSIEFEVENGKISKAYYTDEDKTDVEDTVDETKAGYYLVDDTTIVVTDAVKVSEDNEVYISKKDATNKTGKELAGAKLTVTYIGESKDISLKDIEVTNSKKIVAQNETSITFMSGEKSAELHNLPAGEYKLTEDTAPLGYAKATEVTFTVNEDGTVTSGDKELKDKTVTLTDKVIELTIDKVEIAGDDAKELVGAKLTITNTDGTSLENVTVSGGATEVSKSEDKTSITFISGDKATVLTKLPAGNYTLEEIATPTNDYQKADEISFVIGTDGKLLKDSVQNAYAFDTNIENANGKVLSNITMLDTKAGEVVISKIDITTTKGVKGALLTIETNNENGISNEVAVSGRRLEEALTEENKYDAYMIKNGVLSFYSKGVVGATTISGLTDGTYTLKEENAPEGYLISKDEVTFTIKDGKISSKAIVIKDEAINVTISKWDIANSKELADATLTIKGDNLQKAVNAIYALDEDGESVKLISNEEDPTSISYKTTGKKVTIYGLPAGDYTLTEESAPEGYEKAEEIKFTIDETGKVSSDDLDDTGVIVMNDDIITDKVQVTISKKDATSGKELAGAKLTVTYTGTEDISLEDIVTIKGGATEKEINGKSITFKSGATATMLENLPAGTYTLTEDTAPLGYTTATQVTFTVNEDGTVTSGTETLDKNRVTLTDKVIELQIDKVEIAGTGTKELAGAELTIKRTNDDNVTLNGVTVTCGDKEIDVKDRTNNTITFISGEEATILTKLPAGNYTLTEIATPDNTVYQIAETISFTIGKDGKLSKVQDAYSYETDIEKEDGKKVVSNITMLDTKDEVIISKVDSKTDEGVKGALLAIKKLDDENGVSDEITVIGKVERIQVDSLADITEANRYTVYAIEDGILKFYSNNVNICIAGLPAGTYEISELSAPEGYISSTVAQKFEISNTEELKNRLPVEIQNKAINVTISKWDIANSKELENATLTIKGENLKKAVNAIYALDEDDEPVDLVIAE